MDDLHNKYLNSQTFNKNISRKLVSDITKGANSGDVEALAAYSILQMNGYGVEKNLIQAKERLRAFAKSGDPYGMFLCGVLASSSSYGFSGDLHLSENYLRNIVFGSNKGKLPLEKRAVAARILGDYYSGAYAEFEKDDMESFRSYDTAANDGDLYSMVTIGCMLIKGVEGLFDGVIDADEERGVKMLVSASEKGSAQAINALIKYHLKKAVTLNAELKDKDDENLEIGNVLASLEWRL